MGSVEKLEALKTMLGQQALQPGQQQLQQQSIESGNISLQLKQQELKNATVTNSFLSDPNAMDDYKAWQKSQEGSAPASAAIPNASGATPAPSAIPNAFPVPLHPLAQYLAEKKGLPLYGPGGAMDVSDQLTKAAQSIATLQSTQGDIANKQLTAHGTQLKNFDELAQPILSETDPAKQTQGLADLRTEIQAHPELYPPEATQHLDKLNTVQGLQQGFNTSQLRQMVIDEGTKQAGLQSAASGAVKAAQEIAPPTQAQLDTFTKTTLPSFANVTPAQRASFAQEAQQARTVPEFNKVVSDADATDKAMQMHADSLAQTRAIMGDKFGQAGLTENEKVWTDPARGYAAALAQANQTKQSIKAGADGNGLVTSMVPTMEVLGINHAAGINRISPQEAHAAGLPGSWAEQWNAWATKAMTGKLTPQLASQGNQLMDIVSNAAYTRAVQSSQVIAKGHNLPYENTPAMNRDGSITTLDKVAGGGGNGANQNQSQSARPASVPATFVHIKASDGSTHWVPSLAAAKQLDPGAQSIQ